MNKIFKLLIIYNTKNNYYHYNNIFCINYSFRSYHISYEGIFSIILSFTYF